MWWDQLVILTCDVFQANVPNEAAIYLEQELDAETKSEYQLILTLTDGHLGEGNFITQSMLILVEDINDNAPVFRDNTLKHFVATDEYLNFRKILW